jgi:hypothetical protein
MIKLAYAVTGVTIGLTGLTELVFWGAWCICLAGVS